MEGSLYCSVGLFHLLNINFLIFFCFPLCTWCCSWIDAAKFLTGASAVGSLAIPIILRHAHMIETGAMFIEFTSFFIFACTVLCFHRASLEDEWWPITHIHHWSEDLFIMIARNIEKKMGNFLTHCIYVMGIYISERQLIIWFVLSLTWCLTTSISLVSFRHTNVWYYSSVERNWKWFGVVDVFDYLLVIF